MNKKILITGASGMVGSHTLKHLLHQHPGSEFVAVCGWTHKGEPENVFWAMEGHEDRVQVITHDLSVPFTPRLKAKIGKPDIIVNIASESHVDRSIEEPVDFVANNIMLALNLLEFAREIEPEVFLQFSTDEVYGPAHESELHGEWSPIVPSNPYAASKACQEALAVSYWRTYGVPVIITNTMNVFSPRQDWEKFIPLCVDRVLRGDKIYIHAYPGAEKAGTRFYIHADSVAEAVDFLIQQPPPMYPAQDRPGRYNIVGDKEMDNLAIASRVAEIVGRPLVHELVDFHSSRPGHDARYALDGSLLKSMGWEPSSNFDHKFEEVVQELAQKHAEQNRT